MAFHKTHVSLVIVGAVAVVVVVIVAVVVVIVAVVFVVIVAVVVVVFVAVGVSVVSVAVAVLVVNIVVEVFDDVRSEGGKVSGLIVLSFERLGSIVDCRCVDLGAIENFLIVVVVGGVVSVVVGSGFAVVFSG